MSENNTAFPSSDELEILQKLIASLAPMDSETRLRLLETAATFLRIEGIRFAKPQEPFSQTSFQSPVSTNQFSPEITQNPRAAFSDRPDIAPKEFMADKDPKTDIEKAVCLAYYLTHYRNLPHFKTLDISKLNTEAAQVKFSNPTFAVENAARLGFLVPAAKGMRQVSALGEQFVRALPDREAAKLVREKLRPRRTKKGGKTSASPEIEDNEDE